MREKRNAYRVFVSKPERQRPLGRPRHKWEKSSQMDLKRTGWEGMDWICLTQERETGSLLRTW